MAHLPSVSARRRRWVGSAVVSGATTVTVAATAVITNVATSSTPAWLAWLLVGTRPWWILGGLVLLTLALSVIASHAAADGNDHSNPITQQVTVNVAQNQLTPDSPNQGDVSNTAVTARESRIVTSATGFGIIGDGAMRMRNVRYTVSESGAFEFTADYIYIEDVPNRQVQVERASEEPGS